MVKFFLSLIVFPTLASSLQINDLINSSQKGLKAPINLNPNSLPYNGISNNGGQCKLNKSLAKSHPFNVEMNKYAFGIPKGQCTEWADGRYFELTGHHPLFNGDAHKWNELASSTPGWEVSNEPFVPSIMVIEQFTNGATQYGHVAIVESIIDENTVCTSNWNFPNPGRLTLNTFKLGNGVTFIRYVE